MRLTAALFVVLLASRLAHSGVLWAEEGLPLAAASQVLWGRGLYREIWFDKPPLLAAFYLLAGGQAGWWLRVLGAGYAALACWLAGRFARDLWGPREGRWAAGLLAFYLTFYIHSAVIPLAADLLMLVPHLAAVYLAWKRRPFWSGVLAGIAILVNVKGAIVLAAAALFCPRGVPLLAVGFAAPLAAAGAWLWWHGALAACYEQVWHWGRVYAGGTFVANPAANAVERTLNWAGFHLAAVLAAAWFWPRSGWRWLAWAALSGAAVAMGWRFFPRYFFQLLPVVVLAAARGLELMGGRRWLALALLIVPLVRFGPRYFALEGWRDTAMDRDSRAAARVLREWARPGDSLFVWGFRPELYVYTGLPATSRFLDSQPLTGVPADRHLTQSETVAPELAAANRAELARTRPLWIVDGLGLYNPRLAPAAYPDVHAWLAPYREMARAGGCIIYRRASATGPP